MDKIDDMVRDGEMGKVLPRCLICGEVPAGGIRDGIKMKRGFICGECERKIIGLQPGSLEYEGIIGKLKTMLT